MQVSILCLVSALTCVMASPLIEYTLSASQTGFDFLPAINYTEYCAKCEGNSGYTIHPYSCRISMVCDRLTKTVSLFECSAESDMHNAYFTCNKANSFYGLKCLYDEQNNPCYSSRPIPSGRTCNGYYVCDEKKEGLKKDYCGDGLRFDFESYPDFCVPDDTCRSSEVSNASPIQINATCSKHADDISKYEVKEYLKKGDVIEMIISVASCPASMTFDESLVGTEFCCSKEKTVEIGDCVPQNLVYASSTNDTWSQSLSGHDTPYSKVEGNATILRYSNTQFNGWAYFNGSTTYSARKMSNNELRYYWNLQFQFQAGELSGNTVIVGMQRTGKDGNSNSHVALIDNSICDIEGTYGCYIVVQNTNRGKVECFVNNHTVSTDELDLTRVISVELKREASVGTLMVKPDGLQMITRTFTFAEGEVVEGRDCPMTMAFGYMQRNFVGFMDNVIFSKTCA